MTNNKEKLKMIMEKNTKSTPMEEFLSNTYYLCSGILFMGGMYGGACLGTQLFPGHPLPTILLTFAVATPGFLGMCKWWRGDVEKHFYLKSLKKDLKKYPEVFNLDGNEKEYTNDKVITNQNKKELEVNESKNKLNNYNQMTIKQKIEFLKQEQEKLLAQEKKNSKNISKIEDFSSIFCYNVFRNKKEGRRKWNFRLFYCKN